MRNEEGGNLRERTKAFAVRVIRLYQALPRRGETEVIGKQLLRSGTSVGAQYREAYQARSPAEFVSKVESAAQEMDETLYWFELLNEVGLINRAKLEPLAKEGGEILAMLAASARTVKKRNSK